MTIMTMITMIMACVVALAGSVESSSSSSSSSSHLIDLEFDTWLQRHDKSYSTNDEYLYRQAIWSYNQQQIVQVHNDAYERGYTTYTMTINSPFADLTDDEFETQYLMPKQPRGHCALAAANAVATTAATVEEPSEAKAVVARAIETAAQAVASSSEPSSPLSYPSIDWRTHGVITPVKDQGSCGSCWTFSTTGVVEAHTCIAHHHTDCDTWEGLSEQQLVDCSSGFGENSGCDGGWPSSAMEYIRYNGGIESESSYPYHAKDEKCRPDSIPQNSRNINNHDNIHNPRMAAQVTEVYNVTFQDEDEFQSVLSTVGPVSFAFQVSPDLRFYERGVYDSYNATTNRTMCHSDEQYLNHAVVAIGMGVTESDDNDDKNGKDGNDGGIPYYIVRNSWSTLWAMEGYFWLKRGTNLCGVADCASFPIVPVIHNHPDHNDPDQRQHLRASTAQGAVSQTIH